MKAPDKDYGECLSAGHIMESLDGLLTRRGEKKARRHLRHCAHCRQLESELAAAARLVQQYLTCPDDEAIAAYVDDEAEMNRAAQRGALADYFDRKDTGAPGTLSSREVRRISLHLGHCPRCQAQVALLESACAMRSGVWAWLRGLLSRGGDAGRQTRAEHGPRGFVMVTVMTMHSPRAERGGARSWLRGLLQRGGKQGRQARAALARGNAHRRKGDHWRAAAFYAQAARAAERASLRRTQTVALVRCDVVLHALAEAHQQLRRALAADRCGRWTNTPEQDSLYRTLAAGRASASQQLEAMLGLAAEIHGQAASAPDEARLLQTVIDALVLCGGSLIQLGQVTAASKPLREALTLAQHSQYAEGEEQARSLLELLAEVLEEDQAGSAADDPRDTIE